MSFDPHKQALEELMSHLNQSDDDDLDSAMKPKGTGVEMMKVEALPGGDSDAPDSGVDSGDGTSESGPKLSDEEIQELIEALQSKLG